MNVEVMCSVDRHADATLSLLGRVNSRRAWSVCIMNFFGMGS